MHVRLSIENVTKLNKIFGDNLPKTIEIVLRVLSIGIHISSVHRHSHVSFRWMKKHVSVEKDIIEPKLHSHFQSSTAFDNFSY